MLNRIKSLCQMANISVLHLEKETGITPNTINKWSRIMPSADKVLAVAQFFGVSVDYLLTGKEDSIPPKDALILRKWHKLDDTGRGIVEYLINAEIKRADEISAKNTMTLIPMIRSIQKASAGTGCYLGVEEFERVYVEDSPETRQAAFIVQVAGDSMEPLYHDGDQLLVERAEDIGIGEIGIFTVNGDGYVKKRGDGELISLNDQYEAIPLTPESWCNGRVIGVLPPDKIY